jgi:DNA-binding transcriptional LysR family regulator
MELELSGATQRYSVAMAMAMVLLIAGVAIAPHPAPAPHLRHECREVADSSDPEMRSTVKRCWSEGSTK